MEKEDANRASALIVENDALSSVTAALAAVALCLQFASASAEENTPQRLILAQATAQPSFLPDTPAIGLKTPRTDATSGLYYPLGASWTFVAEANASPTHQVLPRYSPFWQLHKSLPAGWGMGLGLRHSEYSQIGTNTVSLLAERYWGNFRGVYTLYSGRPEGASSASSHRFQLSYYYDDRSSIGLSYSKGREVENVGPPHGVILSDVQNLALSGRHWFTPNWALTYDLINQEQGTLYRRHGLRLGIRHSF